MITQNEFGLSGQKQWGIYQQKTIFPFI